MTFYLNPSTPYERESRSASLNSSDDTVRRPIEGSSLSRLPDDGSEITLVPVFEEVTAKDFFSLIKYSHDFIKSARGNDADTFTTRVTFLQPHAEEFCANDWNTSDPKILLDALEFLKLWEQALTEASMGNPTNEGLRKFQLKCKALREKVYDLALTRDDISDEELGLVTTSHDNLGRVHTTRRQKPRHTER